MTTAKKRLVVGTRGSALALRQTQQIVDQLKGLYPDMEVLVEVRRITTEGDRRTDVPLVQIAGQG
ncbi:MAG: hydroxymethylbilane synthase, partial [Dehalococcoidia bacterium]|nr:hydroxymethylbilane synthase [Dehalococcoidia bacterium]